VDPDIEEGKGAQSEDYCMSLAACVDTALWDMLPSKN